MLRIGVLGCGGKMGRTISAAILREGDLELVSVIDPSYEGALLSSLIGVDTSLVVSGNLDDLLRAGANVAIDFTERMSAYKNALFLAENNIHAIIGTTGLTKDEIEKIAARFKQSSANLVIAVNFSVGANLMIEFSKVVARYFDAAEIIELHHEAKKDSPSGTAIMTAKAIKEAREKAKDVPLKFSVSEVENLQGARGASYHDEIAIHSVRLPGLVAHQETIFGMQGEILTIRHDSFSRESFMFGLLATIRKIEKLNKVTTSLTEILNLASNP